MKSLDEAPGAETLRLNNNWEGESRSETSHNVGLLIVKPCQRTRAVVKGQTGRESHSNVINALLKRSYFEAGHACDIMQELALCLASISQL